MFSGNLTKQYYYRFTIFIVWCHILYPGEGVEHEKTDFLVFMYFIRNISEIAVSHALRLVLVSILNTGS